MLHWIMIFLLATPVESTPTHLHPDSKDSLVDAAIAIIESCFVAHLKSIILSRFFSNKWANVLDDLLIRLNYKVPVTIVDSTAEYTDYTENCNEVHHVVVLIDTKDAYYDFCILLRKKNFNINSFFIIIFLQDEEPWMPTSLLQLTAELQVFNVVALFNVNEVVHLYNCIPFGSILYRSSSMINDQICFNSTMEDTRDCDSYFIPKVSNFFAVPLHVATIEYPPLIGPIFDEQQRVVDFVGIDGDILKCLSQVLNFTIIPFISYPPILWGEIYDNGTGTGAEGRVLNGKANFTLGYNSIDLNKHKFLSYTYPHYYASYVLFISPGLEYGPFERLLIPFQISLWISFGAVFSIGIITIIVLNIFPKPVQSFVFGSSNRSPILNFIQSTLGYSVESIPTRNFARFLLLMWISFCFILRTAYQQIMFEHLCRQRNHSTPQNWNEFITEGYRLYSGQRHMRFYEYFPADIQSLITIIEPEEYAETEAKIVNGYVRGATCQYLELIRYGNKESFVYRNDTFKQIFPKTVITYPNAIYFQKNSPLVDIFDEKVKQLVNHGFVEHGRQKAFGRNLEKDIQKLLNLPKAHPMSLKVMIDVFGLYVVGMLLSALIFCLEFVLWRMNDKQRLSVRPPRIRYALDSILSTG
ncbi:uncharacterized protein LOC129757976 [Uranotaenia lowii]|uniref:uncharacterized protein LOC129757976 n=1 Tax=Uranotaenia lowii TaxID=190385 RepID=UPI0024787D25|nr:uncharacterized protein LOC129757976 [Uranotaenia lowii]